jgi:glycosyltransferase involved in cell wall biosynthesis
MIITPIYPPVAGGAATYYGLLSRGLLANGSVKHVTVITEYYGGRNCDEFAAENIEVVSLFPFRAGGKKNKIQQYLLYGMQNLLYMFIPYLVRKHKPDVVIVHSSFHNFFNLIIAPVVRRLSTKVPLIADVRDHQLPAQQLKQLEPYHALIACSLNICNHIQQSEILAGRISHIPVIQESIGVSRQSAIRTLDKYELAQDSYLLYAGLIKADKGIELLMQTYEVLCSRGCTLKLIIVGEYKDSRLLKRLLSIPGVRWLGPVVREELLDLMSCSSMSINLSSSEGMPRTSLEALALGVQVLLPKGIPEFDEHCKGSVVCSTAPELVASQIERLLLSQPEHNYPIEEHAPDYVLSKYEQLFDKLISEFRSGSTQ